MMTTSGYATHGPTSALEPFSFERREPGPHDVLIEILYCGVCHTDIHQTRDEWGASIFPIVPGQEEERRALLLRDRHGLAQGLRGLSEGLALHRFYSDTQDSFDA